MEIVQSSLQKTTPKTEEIAPQIEQEPAQDYSLLGGIILLLAFGVLVGVIYLYGSTF